MKNFLLRLFILISLIAMQDVSNAQTTVTYDNGVIGVSLHKVYIRFRLYLGDVATGKRLLDRSTILVGTAPDKVFDYKLDFDPVDTPNAVANPAKSDFEIYGSYGNARSQALPNVLVKMNIYAWQSKRYVIMKFNVINLESSSQSTYLGMESILNTVGLIGGDTVDYLPQERIIYSHRNDSGILGNLGYKILSAATHSVESIEYFANYWLGDTLLYRMLSQGTLQQRFVNPDVGEPSTLFFSQPAVTVNAGDSTSMYVAIAVGGDAENIKSIIAEAENVYTQWMGTGVEREDLNIPKEYVLSQNYPNPFNPTTRISFKIKEANRVKLQVMNVLGEEIQTIVDEILQPGSYSANFNAASLPSGIYLCRLSAGNSIQTIKMSLTK